MEINHLLNIATTHATTEPNSSECQSSFTDLIAGFCFALIFAACNKFIMKF